jgi:hypothetical protein
VVSLNIRLTSALPSFKMPAWTQTARMPAWTRGWRRHTLAHGLRVLDSDDSDAFPVRFIRLATRAARGSGRAGVRAGMPSHQAVACHLAIRELRSARGPTVLPRSDSDTPLCRGMGTRHCTSDTPNAQPPCRYERRAPCQDTARGPGRAGQRRGPAKRYTRNIPEFRFKALGRGKSAFWGHFLDGFAMNSCK